MPEVSSSIDRIADDCLESASSAFLMRLGVLTLLLIPRSARMSCRSVRSSEYWKGLRGSEERESGSSVT